VVHLKGILAMRYLIASIALALPLGAWPADLKTVVLDVRSMTCGLCPLTVRQALRKVPGVASATVDFDRGTATVEFDADRADTAALVKATTDAGFPSAPRR
jgi:periplasmic mercuric ion binding protein